MAELSRRIKYTIDLNAPLIPGRISGVLMEGDNRADTIEVVLMDGMKQVASSTVAAAAAAYVTNVDGQTLMNVGTVGESIIIPMDASCYAVPGHVTIRVAATSADGVERTMITVTGTVSANGEGVMFDPGDALPSYADLVVIKQEMQEATANATQTLNAALEDAEERVAGAVSAAEDAATAANESASGANKAAANASDAAALCISVLMPENYHLAMKAWFSINGAGETDDLTELCERWYSLTRTGWEGGTRFWQPDKSSLSTGTKVGDNADMFCEPSTNTYAGRDDYANIPLFAPVDVNWFLDENGKRHIRAIKGIGSLHPFVKTDPAHPVGVMQMAPWVKVVEDADTYTYWMTDKVGADGYVPVSEAIDLAGTIHSFVVHGKYGYNDGGWSSISGVNTRRYDVSHDSQRTNVRSAWGNNHYCGKSCADDAWVKLHVYIKYASLTLDGIMNGCGSYYWSTAPTVSVAETGVKRVIIPKTNGDYVVIGSRLCIGGTGAKYTNARAVIGSVVYGAIVTRKETYDLGGVEHTALYLDCDNAFSVDTANTVNVIGWGTGATDEVLGNDGSPVNKTSSKEPYKLQGIEQSYGWHEVMGDTINQYKTVDGKNVLGCMVCRDATKISTSPTADYKAVGYTVDCPSEVAWKYIRKLGFDPAMPECMFPVDIVGGSSSTFARDALNILAQGSGNYEWRALGYLADGLALTGLSSANATYGLSDANWSITGRLSPNGSRGEYTA